MKKSLFILPMVMMLLITSCNDEFNINGPSKDIYVLNCILRNDTNIQYAILSKNRYTENGAPPKSTSTDQYVHDAIIKILYNDSVFVMKDTTMEISEFGEKTVVNCYYTSNLDIQNKDIKIEATLPDGKILKSAIRVPSFTFWGATYYFPNHYVVGYYPQQEYQWKWRFKNSWEINMYNFPRLIIYYRKYENGSYVDKETTVPVAYNYDMYDYGIFKNGVYLALKSACGTTLKTMNQTMHEISGDDPYKQNYVIKKVVLNVIGLEENLAKYYFASNTYGESFTIKLRPTEISNIEGGVGIFGGYFSYSKLLEVDSIYVNSFGYRYDPLP